MARKRRLKEYLEEEEEKEEHTETKLRQEAFQAYYRGQGIFREDEWKVFMNVFHKSIPAAFRINSSEQFREDIRSQIENEFMETLEFEVTDGDEGIHVRPLTWYPNKMAWQFNCSWVQLMSNQTLERFCHFLDEAADSGRITRQETVSMVPPLFLDVRPEHFVLHMCAGPGSKTSQLLEIMHQSCDSMSLPAGLVIANAVDCKSCDLHIHQSKRMQCANLIVTNHEAQHFPSCKSKNGLDTSGLGNKEIIELSFDRVLCDVPCSGDGTLRKAPYLWRKWSACMGNGMHQHQVQTAMRGIALLKLGGRMVYTTCSMNPVENEAVVSEILRRCGGSVELLDVSTEFPQLVRRPGIKSWKVYDKGAWLASYKDVLEDRRTAIAPSMFPSGQSFDEETSVPSGLGKRVVPPGSDIEMENMEEKTESVCNVVPDHVTKRSEIFVSPNDALEMEVSDLPLERCMRIVPQDQNTGALFIAILRKVSPLAAVSSSTEAKEGDANSLDVSLEEGNQLSPILSCVASGTESSYKRPENGASGLDSHVVVKVENEKEDAKETDPMIAGDNRRSENQGMWRGVAPVVFTREATVLSNTMDFCGISDSFPLNEHLATQNTDFQSCKRNYYISKSVRDVMKLNVQVGQQLKIVSVGVEAIVEQDDAHKVSCERPRRHGTTIIGGSNSAAAFITSDGFEADPIFDVNGKFLRYDIKYVEKTDVLFGRILVVGAGDSVWIDSIVKNLKCNEEYDTEMCARDAHLQMAEEFLEDADLAEEEQIDAHMYFASFEDDGPKLYFACKETPERRIPQGEWFVIGGELGRESAENYLRPILPSFNDISAKYIVDQLLLAMKAACNDDPYTGGPIRVHYLPRKGVVYRLRDVDESLISPGYIEILNKVEEDFEIDGLVRRWVSQQRQERRFRQAARQGKLKWFKSFSSF